MQLWWCSGVLWLNTAWSGHLGTPVGTTNCLCLQQRNCRFRPRSQQASQNNGNHLPDSMASRLKPLRFSRSPPWLEISRPNSYVFSQTSSLKWDFEIWIMWIINILLIYYLLSCKLRLRSMNYNIFFFYKILDSSNTTTSNSL